MAISLLTAPLDGEVVPTENAPIVSLCGRLDLSELRCLVGVVLRLIGHKDGGLNYDARLCLSELYGNALRHAGGPTHIRFWHLADSLRVVIAVTDRSTTPPALRDVADETKGGESGRGLLMVGLVAHEVGYVLHADGKDVWCSLSLQRSTDA
jgi:anti-sigma regulatory factor (Ser/Thr protein kinase)